jgi:methylenetetrahydrofolate dehydrogenase (NADP+) / methenyltetrahydrofolate cyclohydrolase
MTAQLLDGRLVSQQLRLKLSAEIKSLPRAPGLAVILVGTDPASTIYVRNKQNACQHVGIRSQLISFDTDVSQTALCQQIEELNQDPCIDGILVQLPLPAHIEVGEILETIDPHKDVDGFHPYNLGRLAQRRPLLRPCTPYGIIQLLDSIHYDFQGVNATVVGASNIVGRPLALELLHAEATVTVAHRATQHLAEHVKNADLLVVAVGQQQLIPGAWIKPGATVIDVGINRLSNGQLVGDVDFSSARERAAWITPVPGGVGPMTVSSLLQNTLTAYRGITSCIKAS